MTRRVCVALSVGCFVLFGCDGGAVDPPGEDGGQRRDGGPVTMGCVLDRECQNGVFCDGEERCMPGATDADERGCVAALEPACGPAYECMEEARVCRRMCDVEVDADGDGHDAIACGGDDCDDEDANRYPGNTEVCDPGHDEDCNPLTFGFTDGDGDGSASNACCNGDACGDDCNDGDSLINPRAGEACDGVDNNCVDGADEECPCMPGETRLCGMDEGACQQGRIICVEGIFGDCVGAIGPAEEVCDGVDNDCDAMTDEHVLRTYYEDRDGDGFGVSTSTVDACSVLDGWASNSLDCDDARAGVNPIVPEVCNGIDDDCDTSVDEGLMRTYYLDSDGDGFGAPASAASACTPPSASHVERGGDCDDTSASRSPVGLEACNAADDDCDTSVDEGVLRTYYRDQDGDGVGGMMTATGCTPPTGYVAASGDCDDANAARFPGRYDACNGVDDDCDGTTDPGCTCTDGARRDCGTGPGGGAPTDVGECAIGSQICVGGTWGSCVGAAGPSTETCDGRDEDCDGAVDEGVTVPGCLGDGDGDGYGAGVTTTQCRDAARSSAGFCPPGWTTTAGDCNDANATVRPMGAEACNSIDDDCDTLTDEGTTATGCYADADGDSYGIGSATTQCRDAARATHGYCPAGFTNRGGDCNDSSSAVRPGAAEACNGRDDDCSMMPDDGPGMICVAGTSRSGTGSNPFCASVPGTYTCVSCTSETFTPSPPAETCNGMDDDCDGSADDAFECRQSSTGHACVTGCGTVGTRGCSASCSFAGQACTGTEVCNGCDDDGDGVRDDGLGAGGSTVCYLGQTRSCTRTCGSTSVSGTQRCLADCSGWGDCVAAEVCNGCDDDGDGTADNGFFCAQSSVTYCTTGCSTPGQQVCNSTCTAYTGAGCAAISEYCNYCDDDGDGTYQDDRPLATVHDEEEPRCPGLTSYGSAATCPSFVAGNHTVAIVNNTFSSRGAMWLTPARRVGWGPFTFSAEMRVSKSSSGYLPADGWAMVIADGGSGNVGAVGGSLGVPMTRTGLAIEWRFYNNDPNVDQVDTITVRRLTGSGTGTILRGATSVPAAADFGNGDVSLTQRLTVEYRPDDPATISNEELLQVWVTGRTTPLITLTDAPIGVLSSEFAPASMINFGVTAATGGRTFVGALSLARDFSYSPRATYLTYDDVCF